MKRVNSKNDVIPTAKANISPNITIDVHVSPILEAERPSGSKSPKRIIQQSTSSIQSCINVKINEEGARTYLQSYGWPSGLIQGFCKSCKKIPIRFFVCDDSGSMLTNDGHKCMKSSQNDYKMVKCSRWAELVDSLKFHSHLAHIANTPTEFRTLNMAEPVLLGTDQSDGEKTLNSFLELISESPGGQTPLCANIKDVIEKISSIQDVLRQQGQKACLIIATDGEATDGDLAEAMRPLESLPVWVVVRLCTDEEKVVKYWNEIDGELELDMDVLDDLQGEAEEVNCSQKGWLTYDEKLHRFREFGAIVKEMDLLDESLLSSDQMLVVASLLIPIKLSDIPHPEQNWISFLAALKTHNTQDIWCPITKKMKKYLDMGKLKQIYGEGKASSSSCNIC